ncbi:hypothetical protein D3C73_640390 [compost metagenome]
MYANHSQIIDIKRSCIVQCFQRDVIQADKSACHEWLIQQSSGMRVDSHRWRFDIRVWHNGIASHIGIIFAIVHINGKSDCIPFIRGQGNIPIRNIIIGGIVYYFGTAIF